MKIAICDDDRNDIRKLRELLNRYDEDNNIGFSVSEYESGAKLLDSISRGEDPDIIFLDINMGEMDGLSVAKEIREKKMMWQLFLLLRLCIMRSTDIR